MNFIELIIVLTVLLFIAYVVTLAIKQHSTATVAPVASNATPGTTAATPGVIAPAYADHVTPFDDDGGGNVRYLDRQNVDCFVDGQVNGGLNSFVLTQQAMDSGKVNYSYKCMSTTDSVTKDKCRAVSTTKDDDGAGSPEYLDRHIVACNDGEELSQFKLNQIDGPNKGKIQYDYTCCPSKKSTCRDVTTTTTPFGWGASGTVPRGAITFGTPNANSRFLDHQNVQCGPNETLRKFQLIQPSGPDSNTLAYKYTCCS